jgi:hypothetical protein
MPGLLGYMVAIVVTLGGYLAGLHWLVSPPDPWQSNPKTAQLAQRTAKKRVPPAVTPAEASTPPAASKAPNTELASVETLVSIQASEPERVQPARPNSVETTRPNVEPARITPREVSPAKTMPGKRTRVERNTSRKLD